ncbi:SmvA family efflux MFS transporter [Acinetobacter johnsonii]|uniref:SmvA family efflux MFS transporter n=1 Tax=Acinetobacter johnsonii TaxID=40214 RepID=UPI001F387FDE|nr:SmvA family efflux MFS transporter [Acinetobacter johnsonii]UJA04338.1 SmvA family efflux MFS transporter [Acinetobacter johnsonii]
MSRKWVILAIIVLIYLPVSIDATVLHVAIPTLSSTLSLSANEMLWVIDIYSLIMAGLILPMGALGDRIGFKRLMLIGASIFGVASLMAAFANSAYMLIAARAFLGVGAAMILPATLAGVRNTFLNEKQRNYALGVWGTVGGGGAAFGPLLGGFILEHFSWGAVFLINVPIIILVLILTIWLVPKQKVQTKQPLNLLQALILVIAILMLIYSIKTSIYAFSFWMVLVFAVGLCLLVGFVRHQLRAVQPMIDFSLFKNPVISTSIVMAMVAMIALVGFELLLSQELQFVYGYTPLEAGLFILPFMIAISIGGPFTSVLMNHYGLRPVATVGMLMCAVCFFGLAMTDFGTHYIQAWVWMVLMGISVEIALLSSTAAIMSAVSPEKATAAGAIEGMAYELGAGLGVAIFGLLLSLFYAQAIVLPEMLPANMLTEASSSIGEAISLLRHLDPTLIQELKQAASDAFIHSHSKVLTISGVMFLILSVFVWRALPDKVKSADS